MNKDFASFVIWALVGVGSIVAVIYFWDFFSDSVPESIVEVEKISYFEQNSFCVKQKDDIKKDMSLDSSKYDHWHEKLIEIFYSPQHDSCVYVSEVRDLSIGYGVTIIKRLVDYRMEVGSDPLFSCEYADEPWALGECEVFDEKVKDLKDGVKGVNLYE